MKIVYPFIYTIILFQFAACQRNKVNLIATVKSDRISIDQTAIIKLELQGIECKQFDWKLNNDSTISTRDIDVEAFNTSVHIPFTTKGEYILGPFHVEVKGRKYYSNKVKIYVEEYDKNKFHISMPDVCYQNEKVEINIIVHSVSFISLQLKEKDFIHSLYNQTKTEICDGVGLTETKLTVVFKKAGEYKLTRDSFKEIPEYMIFEPVLFTVLESK